MFVKQNPVQAALNYNSPKSMIPHRAIMQEKTARAVTSETDLFAALASQYLGGISHVQLCRTLLASKDFLRKTTKIIANRPFCW